MGNVRSNELNCNSVPKRPKLEPTSSTNRCSTLLHHQSSLTSYFTTSKLVHAPWETLPYVALMHVYDHLSCNDKASMARTCKTWLLPFNRPALWRRGSFLFDGVEDWRAMRFAAMMGMALRHLSVNCAASEEKPHTCAKTSSVNFSIFLNSLLNSQNRKLETLRFRNLCRLFRPAHLDNYNDVFQPLISLIKRQDGLQTLDVTNSGIVKDCAFELLESIPQPDKLKRLEIHGLLTQVQRFDMSHCPRFLRIVASFNSLTELSVSYEYISHDLLMTLSRTVSMTLRRMEVKAVYNLRGQPTEELEESWSHFCAHMNNLDLSYIIKGMFAGPNLIKLLPPSLSLCRLEWDVNIVLTNIRALCLHIAVFKDTLQELVLRIRIVSAADTEYLVCLVKSLMNLKLLDIESPMIPSSSHYLLETSLRRLISSKHPDDRLLKTVSINGNELDLKENWSSYIIGWLSGDI